MNERREDEAERRVDMKELIRKIDDLTDVVQTIKGNQSGISQYLQVLFGGKDLVGTAMEGNVTRSLREINDKIKTQNGRIGKLENWQIRIIGIAIGASAVFCFVIKIFFK